MKRVFSVFLVTAFLWLAACQTQTESPEPTPTTAPPTQKAIILAINDVYRIEGAANGTLGGLARVRTLRKQLEADGAPVLLLHAGDALSPNTMSKHFSGGEQMIDILNLMDGARDTVDPYMVMTFGNHEFDIKEADMLDARVEQSEFTWLDTNIDWADTPDSKEELVQADNLLATTVIPVGDMKIGVFSLTTPDTQPDYIDGFGALEQTTLEVCAALREQGADVVVGLTHLRASEDEELLRKLAAKGPDLIVGGHDHTEIARNIDGRWLVKADADALSARVVTIEKDGGTLQVKQNLVKLGEGALAEKDETVEAAVVDWMKKFDPEGKRLEPVGTTQVVLTAEELTIRKYETNIGNWIADQMRTAYPNQKVDLALINSGSLRLNDVIPVGAVRKGHIDELLPYQTGVFVVELSGADVKRALNRSIEDWTGSGHYLQVSGIRFTHNAKAQTVSDIRVGDGDQAAPLDEQKTYAVAISSYIAGGGDGYPYLKDATRLAQGVDLEELLLERLKQAGETGIAPKVEGRVNTIE
ncbi:bifunctional metallophosphatase/5'-nucleotidase [Acanthopleuribacter pedis]|uniref:Bifunctional metallophosphatase/5'-nucleotidase n=1 Tax=Acanthopleuribacter pedis TaxID=442870 RepID=A0A8J7QMX3_9BACT|nr:bifunctional UDP-sugar hydrolase/5'-nucleotidase [Acanthopleuribacter pedis]MBO1320950.1 bifunctional metallophosphatase/5'-nucleotidase [Acanthopleuribacter pedis]